MLAGNWLMKKSDYNEIMKQPDGKQRLKDMFALPKAPDYVASVALPAGTRVRSGVVNGHPKWGRGGGTQIEIRDNYDQDWYVNVRPIGGK